MGDLRATEMWNGRPADPAVFVDSAAAPVRYPIYAAAPSPYDPIAPYAPPRHFMPPYEYVPERMVPLPPPRHMNAAYGPPEDMVIPGVQHPDGRFEPHPDFVRKPAHPPPEHEKSNEHEEHGKHVVELAVPVCCEACEERVTNYLGETDGVDAVECDIDAQKVKVVGDLAPADVLQRCKKCFKKSTLI